MQLPDHAHRERALLDHASTLLVEAGAGSGKTALMAGRVVAMLADGKRPANVAAITFTELAAGELLTRITRFLDELLAGDLPREVAIAFPAGVTSAQSENLERARTSLGELTVSTIHGFCQALLRPYPVEADMDPGAQIMDDLDSALAWDQLYADFLRRRLSADDAVNALGAFVLATRGDTAAKLRELADALRRRRSAQVGMTPFDSELPRNFTHCIRTFADWVNRQACHEETTNALAAELGALTEHYAPLLSSARNDPGAVFELAVNPPTISAHTQKATWRAWGRKGKWGQAARDAGLSKAEGARLSEEAKDLYDAVGRAWTELQSMLGAHAFSELAGDLRGLLDEYGDYKREAALLDFDDLLLCARDLLLNDAAVRDALSARFSSILVDEFQDTDPVQAEILWLLCGDGEADTPWFERQLRPGALFVVGDPKQAIYRFRGADVDTYVQARDVIRDQLPDNILSITANFRSLAPIIDWVNVHFERPLAEVEGQPGFEALDAVRTPRDEGPHVVALDVGLPEGAKVGAQRDAEAAAVANLCGQLLDSYRLADEDGRRLRAGDIALLAPAGTELWRYERALEAAGISVASQAGKGFFARQEIQDLIAVTRTLADARDTVALGALLRGPLVGLTEEELLDIVHALPREEEGAEFSRLSLWTDLGAVANPVARDVLHVLQGLARRVSGTTPFALLSESVEELRVRPLLSLRQPRSAERALANVDLFLELARPYQVSGLPAFASAMRAKWEDSESQVEGRPDAEEHAVHLITMHSAKGLEWPIVIPINMFSESHRADSVLHDRNADTLHHCLGPVATERYQLVKQAEQEQSKRESMRLLYVACTRAEDLLVLPRPTVTGSSRLAGLGLDVDELPTLEFDEHLRTAVDPAPGEVNQQDRDTFTGEASKIVVSTLQITRRQPSRHETGEVVDEYIQAPADVFTNEIVQAAPDVRGSAMRGTLLHKLMEEVLTGEVPECEEGLRERTMELTQQLGVPSVSDPTVGISTDELAKCVLRTMALPQVVALRDRLLPEIPVRRSMVEDGEETIANGIADAIALDDAGNVSVVIDWKSDVAVTEHQRGLYRAQVRDYLAMANATEGLIVYVTTGQVETVQA